MPRGGIRTRNPNTQRASDLRFTPRGHWNRPGLTYYYFFIHDLVNLPLYATVTPYFVSAFFLATVRFVL